MRLRVATVVFLLFVAGCMEGSGGYSASSNERFRQRLYQEQDEQRIQRQLDQLRWRQMELESEMQRQRLRDLHMQSRPMIPNVPPRPYGY